MQWSTNKTAIQASLNSLGSMALSLITNFCYWSSTEYDSYGVYGLSTTYGFIGNTNKSISHLVRAFCEL